MPLSSKSSLVSSLRQTYHIGILHDYLYSYYIKFAFNQCIIDLLRSMGGQIDQNGGIHHVQRLD